MNVIEGSSPQSAESPERLSSLRAESGNQDGTQAIRRAVTILRIVATYRHPGASMADICDAIQLPRSTTHRILKCLVSEGLLSVDENGHRYAVGQLAYELSLSGLKEHHSAADWSDLITRVARATGQTTYLMARSGGEAVCLQRAEGHALTRVAPVDVGQRRPLGVGGGAIALLAAFDEDEIEHFARSIGDRLRPFKHLDPETLLADTLAAKARGYAVSMGRVFDEVVGIGLALPGGDRPRLAVSITAPRAYFEKRDPAAIAELIRKEIAITTG